MADLSSLAATVAEHWRTALREVVESAVAAGLAWWASLLIFGDHEPIFAAIAAVVALAPGLPSHSKQAIGMIVGVMIGIGVGELALLLPSDANPLWLGIAVFIAMMLATAYAVRPIVGIQAGASAIIVIAGGQGADSFSRFGDAAIGGVIALMFSQVLLTPDPFAIARKAGAKLASEAEEVHAFLRGEKRGDKTLEDAENELRDAENALVEELDYVSNIGTRTLRGRWRRDDIERTVSEWTGLARKLHLALGSVAYARERDKDVAGHEGLDEARSLIEKARKMAKDG